MEDNAGSRGRAILNPSPDLPAVLQHFDLSGHIASVDTIDSGHINDTWLVRIDHASAKKRYVLQRLNAHVFPQPEAVMQNVDRVTSHINSQSEYQGTDRLPGQSQLILIRARDGKAFYRDADLNHWRLWPFIYGATAFDTVQTAQQARGAAAAFGDFQYLVHDLPGPRLNEIIVDFHNTLSRFEQFHAALDSDSFGRAKLCEHEIDIALHYEESAGLLCRLHESGDLPERIVHNDAKLNNVLFDDASGLPSCVIDLDTVMPGLALYDFGDLVRTAAMPVPEDTLDLDSVAIQLDLYEQLVDGYIGSAIGFLVDAELENLAVAGKIITVETGLRFLTDYLSGDVYFRIHRPEQNLDRARAQFAFAASIDENFSTMQAITSRAWSRHAGNQGSSR
jgi:hypothetical protein